VQLFDMFESWISTPDRTEIEVQIDKGRQRADNDTFNTGTAKHRFCKVCGIKVFYVPRSNPDGFDVNVRCLDPPPREIVIRPFDGAQWELSAPALAHLSEETLNSGGGRQPPIP
jgi:hypothetical protein